MGRLHHELRVYEAMEINPPPFQAPKYFGTSADGSLMLERIAKAPLGRHRFMDVEEPTLIDSLVGVASQTSTWMPSDLPTRWPYEQIFTTATAQGLLPPEAAECMMAGLVHHTLVFQHGDMIASNVLADAQARIHLIDFEWSGVGFYDGFDLATLLVNGWCSARLRDVIVSTFMSDRLKINWGAVLFHDLTTLSRDAGGTDWGRRNLDVLRQQVRPWLSVL